MSNSGDLLAGCFFSMTNIKKITVHCCRCCLFLHTVTLILKFHDTVLNINDVIGQIGLPSQQGAPKEPQSPESHDEYSTQIARYFLVWGGFGGFSGRLNILVAGKLDWGMHARYYRTTNIMVGLCSMHVGLPKKGWQTILCMVTIWCNEQPDPSISQNWWLELRGCGWLTWGRSEDKMERTNLSVSWEIRPSHKPEIHNSRHVRCIYQDLLDIFKCLIDISVAFAMPSCPLVHYHAWVEFISVQHTYGLV